MKYLILISFIILLSLRSTSLFALPAESCSETLEGLQGSLVVPREKMWPTISNVCEKNLQFDQCQSVKNRPILHFDFKGSFPTGTRILAFSMIHGDEYEAGSLILYWMQRLASIQPRNSWRLIPLVNPDGWELKTRTNANQIDLNRNFPTKNWEKESQEYWLRQVKKNPRRFPGTKPGSEPETQCLIKHIEEFSPDLVISVHTPLGVLDFDGPTTIQFPKIKMLPQRRLGHIPGSLGRYMWRDRKVPVLTIELKAIHALPSLKEIEELQDLIGTLSIQCHKLL